MFKLMLVDDFFVERENVKDIINQSDLEIRVTCEVSNGREALAAIEKDVPDFLLSDIEMPVMNGLELARIVREKYPQIKVIFFSFYNKFEYVKEAINLDAYAYILKPIVKEEMVASLQKIIDERKGELKKQAEEKELKEILDQSKPLLIDKFTRALFLGFYRQPDKLWERVEFFDLPVKKGCYQVLAVELDDHGSGSENESLEQRELNSIYVTRILKNVTGDLNDCIWTKVDDIHWGVLLSRDAADRCLMQEYADSLSEKLLDSFNQSAVSVSIGQSRIFENALAISEMYEQAIYALKFKFNLGKAQVINVCDIQDEAGTWDINLGVILQDLKGVLGSGQEKLADEYIERLFNGFKVNTPENLVKNMSFSIIICSQIALNEFNASLETVFDKEELIWEKLLKFETILDIKQWLKNILRSMIQYLAGKNKNQSKRVIDSVKDYIEKNFSKGITVKSIADEVYYNPNYLNNVFKQETGVTVLEYITKVRVEKAKKLLADSAIKLYEVSEAVGYSHESYFRNIFKQYTGFSPKEYREKFGMR